ncbi:MAG: hypothetical protein J0L92_10235 [Deltaproteobacteria bacterium]|nr:hypothetical protein [Deltaproteobacteria bacterium]
MSRGLVVGLVWMAVALTVTTLLTPSLGWLTEVAIAIVVVPPLGASWILGARRGGPSRLLVGLLLASPWAWVVSVRFIDPPLNGVGISDVLAALIALAAVTLRPVWVLYFARALDRGTRLVAARSTILGTLVSAAALALAVSALTTSHEPGATEWHALSRFFARGDAMAFERDWLRDRGRPAVSFGRMPIGRSAHVLRLPDTATPALQWQIPGGQTVDVDATSVGWAEPRCDFEGVPTARCPLQSQLPFAVLETDADAIVVHVGPPLMRDTTFCSLDRGPTRHLSLSEIGIRRLGAPREVGVLVVIGAVVGVTSLVFRRGGRGRPRPPSDPRAGYREAATPIVTEESRPQDATREQDLAVLALVSAVWLALPALAAHLHGFVVGLL